MRQEWRQNIDTVMSWFTEEDFNLVTLYYGEPDNVGHAKGPDHPDRKAIIRQIDRTIGYLREAIDRHHLTDTLNVIITSDHGMTTIKKRPLVDEIILNKYLNLIKLASFEILDYGGFGILTPRPGKEQEVFDALSNAPNLTVFKKNEMPESFHLGNSKRLPPIVIVADLGFNLNSRFIVYVNKGDHGFHNGEMDMKTIFRAFGPDFKTNFLSEPFDSIHIYPLMCKLLQIEPAPHNGIAGCDREDAAAQRWITESSGVCGSAAAAHVRCAVTDPGSASITSSETCGFNLMCSDVIRLCLSELLLVIFIQNTNL
uniref:Zgc:153896 n=1 Tax=Lates calcarifer TaxID=8187 RepID=A0A4W6DNK0_LATCA